MASGAPTHILLSVASFRPSRFDARATAILAVFASLVAIALEVAYTIGHYAMAVFRQLP
jgi:hypothetical protein